MVGNVSGAVNSNFGIYALRLAVSLLTGITVGTAVGIAWQTYLEAYFVTLIAAFVAGFIAIFYLMAVGKRTLDKESGNSLIYPLITAVSLVVDYKFGFTFYQVLAIGIATLVMSMIVVPLLPLQGKELYFSD